MAIFQRLSDSFWSYVSPTKTSSPATAPKSKTRAHGKVNKTRQGSLEDKLRQSRSMSPVTRVDSWRESVTAGAKRKEPCTPSLTGAGRRSKIVRMEEEYEYDDSSDVEMEEGVSELQGDASGYNGEEEDEGEGLEEDGEENEEEGEEEDEDVLEDGSEDGDIEADGTDESASQDEDDDMADLAADISATRLRSTKSPSTSSSSGKGFYYVSDIDVDTTLVVSEAEYASPGRRKVINLPTEAFSRGVSTEELQAEGWSGDHILLVQKLALRGFEPLIPRYWKMDFTYLPDALFEPDDEKAFMRSLRGTSHHMHGIKALGKLFEMGGRVRDTFILQGGMKPEPQSRKSVREFMKWTDTDADFDLRTAIPILTFEIQPSDTAHEIIEENARRKMARLHSRYLEAFRAQPSIEDSTLSDSTSNLVAHAIPQIYALVASHTLVALVAYRPDAAEQKDEVRTVAFFDQKDKDYDVWNSLAMAIIACHVRDVRVRVAEETGVGAKVPGQEIEEDDPDL